VILQLNSKPLTKELGFLRICIDMMTPVLCQVVELLGVLIDRVVPLVQIKKLYKFAAHCASLQVMATESGTELTPQHMVFCWQRGDV
jgi:hypothetical protein